MSLEVRLLSASKKKDAERLKDVFSDIYISYKGLVAFTIYPIISNPSIIDDIVDDTFLHFYQYALNHVVNNIKSFLVTTSRNLSLNYIKKYNDTSLDIDIESHDDDSSSSISSYISDIRNEIGEESYNLLYDYYVLEMSSKELANKYHLSSSGLRMRIKRIKSTIRKKYGG